MQQSLTFEERCFGEAVNNTDSSSHQSFASYTSCDESSESSQRSNPAAASESNASPAIENSIVRVKVRIPGLPLYKPFIYMLNQSVDFNIKALLVEMSVEAEDSRFTYLVDGQDLSRATNKARLVLPDSTLTLQRVVEPNLKGCLKRPKMS